MLACVTLIVAVGVAVTANEKQRDTAIIGFGAVNRMFAGRRAKHN